MIIKNDIIHNIGEIRNAINDTEKDFFNINKKEDFFLICFKYIDNIEKIIKKELLNNQSINLSNKKIEKELLKEIFLLKLEIERKEKTIIPNKYIEGGFIHFADIWAAFYKFYQKLYKQNTLESEILDWICRIYDDMSEFDVDLLTDEDKKKYTKSYKVANIGLSEKGLNIKQNNNEVHENIFITSDLLNECGYANIKFNTVDEIIDYVLTK